MKKKKINWTIIFEGISNVIMATCVIIVLNVASTYPTEMQSAQPNTENTYQCTHEPCQCTTEEEPDF